MDLVTARYGVPAIAAAVCLQMVLNDPAVPPFDEKPSARRAVGVLGPVARHVADIDIGQAGRAADPAL